jgi:hypothetical protein
LGLTWVRRFFARFKKPALFSKIEVCRTAGYQPAMSAKREHLCGSPYEVRAKTVRTDMPPAPQLRISCGFVLFSVFRG